VVIEAHGMLMLFPEKDHDRPSEPRPSDAAALPSSTEPDRDAVFRRAFTELMPRVASTNWFSSARPFTDLLSGLQALAAQPAIAADVAAHLDVDPSVENAVEMLFTSVAMSARADWRAAPQDVRGVVARGWFLGRWVPTFLVLDGPILRFLTSAAFRRQNPPMPILREVRKFFQTDEFMRLRHAFAHWSFEWMVEEHDSIIIGRDGSKETVRVTRKEADAFHIITFGVIQAIDKAFLRSRRKRSALSSIPPQE